MSVGIVKWYNELKGYGFITPEGGGPDHFVHRTAVERAGMSYLREGQKLTYDLEQGKSGKSSATNLKAV